MRKQWMTKQPAWHDPTIDGPLEDDTSAASDCLTLLDPKADPKPGHVPALLPDPKPATGFGAETDPASQVVFAPSNNCLAPVSSSPAFKGPVVTSPEPSNPAPAPTSEDSSSAAVSLVVRVGLEGQQCWSKTVRASVGMKIGAVWNQCAAYLGMEQACCTSAICNGQAVSAADQTLLAFGSGSTAQLDFIVKPQGPHALHLRMMDPRSNVVEAVFLRFEQAGLALQRWAGPLSLRFEDVMFSHAGHPINALASFGDLRISSGDVVNVDTKDGVTAATTSHSLSTPLSQVSTPLSLTLASVD